MTNFINCENEFLSLSMEISGKRAHIFLMCSKLFSAIFIKKKISMSPNMNDFWQLRYLASVSGK